MRIVIHLDGGLVQTIYSDEPLSALIIDHDTDVGGEDLEQTLEGRFFAHTEEGEVDRIAVSEEFTLHEAARILSKIPLENKK